MDEKLKANEALVESKVLDISLVLLNVDSFNMGRSFTFNLFPES